MAVILNASTSSGFVQSADTSGEITLQSNGSTKLTVASTGVSGTLVQGTAVASTSGTSIDFTGIPSWAKKITVMFAGVSTNGTSPIITQLGSTSGFTTSGYTGSVSGGASGVVSAQMSAGLNNTYISSAARLYSGVFTIVNITGNTWVMGGTMGAHTSSEFHVTGGNLNLGATLTQIRITTVNGTDTFDAGTINLQYEG